MDYSKFYTPLKIAQVLINTLIIPTPQRVIDICCGSCNLLFAAKKRWNNIKTYGVDILNQVTSEVHFKQADGRTFALSHTKQFPLVVANPPFDFIKEKNQFPQLYTNEFKNFKTSRLEIEMLLANLNILKPKGTLLIILPSSFVEAVSYDKIRKLIANNYYIESIVKLDEYAFGSSKINSYALVIHNEIKNNYTTQLGTLNSKKLNINYHSYISQDKIVDGNWINNNTNIIKNDIDMKRGTISSSLFIKNGQPILHTAKNDIKWTPSKRYISKKINPTVFANNGDIIVSRIGKSAGQWFIYWGKKIPISDCLFRIKDPNGSLRKKIKNRLFSFPLKGVATRYVTMTDFKCWINSLT